MIKYELLRQAYSLAEKIVKKSHNGIAINTEFYRCGYPGHGFSVSCIGEDTVLLSDEYELIDYLLSKLKTYRKYNAGDTVHWELEGEPVHGVVVNSDSFAGNVLYYIDRDEYDHTYTVKEDDLALSLAELAQKKINKWIALSSTCTKSDEISTDSKNVSTTDSPKPTGFGYPFRLCPDCNEFNQGVAVCWTIGCKNGGWRSNG